MPEDPVGSRETPVSQMLASLREVGSNLTYIWRELPGLEMSEEHRGRFLETCAISLQDLYRLQSDVQRLQGESPPSAGVVSSIQESIRGQVNKVDEWVQAVRSLAEAEPRCVVVKILIEESGANMLRAYIGMWESLELLRTEAGDSDSDE